LTEFLTGQLTDQRTRPNMQTVPVVER